MTVPTTYDEAVATLATARSKDAGKPVDNNTRLYERDNGIALRLHNTDIVIYHPSGSMSLFTDGWTTVTTKDRINKALGNRAGVWSVKGRWMIGQRLGFGYGYGGGVPFDEGIVVHPDGTIEADPGLAERVALEDQRNADTRRAIKRFVNGITPERIVAAFDNPGGDCFGCSMVAADGSYPMGGDCLTLHVQEDYFHAHLMLRAIKAKGYRDPHFIMSMIYGSAERGVVDQQFCKAVLTQFLRKNLTVGAVAVK